ILSCLLALLASLPILVSSHVKAPINTNRTATPQITIGIPKFISAGTKNGILSNIRCLKWYNWIISQINTKLYAIRNIDNPKADTDRKSTRLNYSQVKI